MDALVLFSVTVAGVLAGNLLFHFLMEYIESRRREKALLETMEMLKRQWAESFKQFEVKK